jgi:3-deoxy-D-manno-octulosonic-acid transferase
MRMLGWLLNLGYLAALLAVSPLVVWRRLRYGRYRRGWRERLFGALPVRTDFERPLVWLHAVSVGEVVLLGPLLQRLRAARPDLQVLVTTSTDSGYDVAREKLPDCGVSWLPLDFTWSVRRALRRVQPDLVVLAELELWPNLIREVAAAGLPIALINARLSERSLRGYQRFAFLFRPLIQRLQLIAVQNDVYGGRFLALGADRERVLTTGSIKFDGVESDRANPQTQRLRGLLGIDASDRVFIAGSTQTPEELAALETYDAARAQHPNLRLILVPRHRERFDAVADIVTSRGQRLLRRSRAEERDAASVDGPRPVILVDTIGELGAVWGLADVAFVGGSLTAGRGGQNMLEPAAYGAAVLVGPHTENFRQVVEILRDAGGLQVVRDAAELRATVGRWLADVDERSRLGTAARRCVLEQRGATERTVAALAGLLPVDASRVRRVA